MGVVPLRPADPLLGGFYTLSEATRLLRVRSTQRVYRWLQGAEGNGSAAVIQRDYEPLGGKHELSFWDLVEVRFVEHFRAQGLSLQYLRKVAIKAREDFKVRHPFALSGAKFLTDRKKVFQEMAEEEDNQTAFEILTGQYEMFEEVLQKGLSFNAKTALAQEWHPLGEYCPNVVMNPRFAFGHPVVGKKHVPTKALFRLWQAEGGNLNRVARWFGVNAGDVRESIEFELRISA